jgi:LPXTG-motif cell wall-anchored protein
VVVDNNIVMKQITVTAAAAAPQPALPGTGGEDLPLALLVIALAIVLAGGLLKRHSRA